MNTIAPVILSLHIYLVTISSDSSGLVCFLFILSVYSPLLAPDSDNSIHDNVPFSRLPILIVPIHLTLLCLPNGCFICFALTYLLPHIHTATQRSIAAMSSKFTSSHNPIPIHLRTCSTVPRRFFAPFLSPHSSSLPASALRFNRICFGKPLFVPLAVICCCFGH
ncbi:hypothetical protein BC835DRAFT_453117 [Cytidiella melzeri]|nr:hypothetical protein BC835DRAFT_453117 [Cytidiella melzeri]